MYGLHDVFDSGTLSPVCLFLLGLLLLVLELLSLCFCRVHVFVQFVAVFMYLENRT
jgi:hypothetical protein